MKTNRWAGFIEIESLGLQPEITGRNSSNWGSVGVGFRKTDMEINRIYNLLLTVSKKDTEKQLTKVVFLRDNLILNWHEQWSPSLWNIIESIGMHYHAQPSIIMPGR